MFLQVWQKYRCYPLQMLSFPAAPHKVGKTLLSGFHLHLQTVTELINPRYRHVDRSSGLSYTIIVPARLKLRVILVVTGGGLLELVLFSRSPLTSNVLVFSLWSSSSVCSRSLQNYFSHVCWILHELIACASSALMCIKQIWPRWRGSLF